MESVKVENGFILKLSFSNGINKKIDLSALIKNPPPVFALLKNEDEFKKVSINPVGGIQWECGADLSADYLFSEEAIQSRL